MHLRSLIRLPKTLASINVTPEKSRNTSSSDSAGCSSACNSYLLVKSHSPANLKQAAAVIVDSDRSWPKHTLGRRLKSVRYRTTNANFLKSAKCGRNGVIMRGAGRIFRL